MAELKTASVLAFERKLDCSDAQFFSGNWNEQGKTQSWRPVHTGTKSVRGTISNRLKAKDQDPAKLDAQIENANLQTVDFAALPHAHDTLRVSFTLKVLAGTGTPSACNNSEYQAKVLSTVNTYIEANGLKELAKRYAYNLANARFLWRNRMGAEKVTVHISQLVDGNVAQEWEFKALELSLRDFQASGEAAEQLSTLSDVINDGLTGQAFVILKVTAFARMGAGQEVFPSQELILEKGRGDKSKTLYQIEQVAAMHSQKVGNAIRTIDTWYPEATEFGPIAIEPYGSVTTQGRAFRQPKAKLDFYNLLDNWILKDKTPELEQQHYVIANLIRGGVFGDAEK